MTTTNSGAPLCISKLKPAVFFTNFAPQPICYHGVNQVLSKGFFSSQEVPPKVIAMIFGGFPHSLLWQPTTCKSLPSLKLTKMPRENRHFPPKGKVIFQTSIFRFYFTFRLGKFLKPIKLSSTILYNIEATFRQLPASAVPSGHGVTWCSQVRGWTGKLLLSMGVSC